MSSLKDITDRLAPLYHNRATIEIQLAHLKTDLAARVEALRPAPGPKGWGANPDEREANKAAAQLADQAASDMVRSLAATNDALAMLEANIKGVEAAASAARWHIRGILAHSNEVLALAVMNKPADKPDDHDNGDGWDEALDAATDVAQTLGATALLSDGAAARTLGDLGAPTAAAMFAHGPDQLEAEDDFGFDAPGATGDDDEGIPF